jgi:hypothetical protein
MREVVSLSLRATRSKERDGRVRLKSQEAGCLERFLLPTSPGNVLVKENNEDEKGFV